VKTSGNLIIDLLATIIYIVAANPLITGWAVHEWVSIGLLLVFVVHCATHFDWIVSTFRHRGERVRTANLALDVATLIVFMVCMVSGLMVSRHIVPLFGFVSPGYFIWNPIHSLSAKLLLALLIVHGVAHWRWFASLLPWRRALSPQHEQEGMEDETGMDE
jgi:hypothetical protein